MGFQKETVRSIESFGDLTFHKAVMEKKLSKEVFANVKAAMVGREKINPFYADAIASAIKDWAMERGATHFCHWFQPLTGKAVEKHDAFLDRGPQGQIIEKFSGRALMKGEPDASSFPSGGIRQTSAARGYSCWDVQSYPFIWRSGDVSTLCIPAVFFSWCGKALDMKIPLMRSEEKLQQAVLRLLHLLDVEASHVFPTLGCEQEYFLLPKEFLESRPDLLLTGRTLFGSPSARGQELEDRYFSIIPEKVLKFMDSVERKAFELGIALKTRHSEVAPQQYEAAPLFEQAFKAVDHNLLLMQIMQQTAHEQGLACLFHEKPFAGINGSGKHCNWSLQTDAGVNLLDPALLGSEPLLFLSCLAAVIAAVHRHADLLRASIGSAGNDHRLGGHEAPPALISIYLGVELEKLLLAVEDQKEYQYVAEKMRDLEIPYLPHLLLETIDRNRTSPFVFTGNKFEFRSLGASAHPALTLTTLNAIVAESFIRFVDEIEKKRNGSVPTKDVVLSVLQDLLAESRSIRYLGDNYLDEWKDEAASRGLSNIERSLHSFHFFIEPKAEPVFNGILSLEERRARLCVQQNTYAHIIAGEAKLMLELFDTQIVPACLEHQKHLAETISAVEKNVQGLCGEVKELLVLMSEALQKVMKEAKSLEQELEVALALDGPARAFAFADLVYPQMKVFRKGVDALEMKVQDRRWPLPKYRELLFSL